MSKVIIFTSYYFDFTNKVKTIGGVQTYVADLASLIKSLNKKCIIYQVAPNRKYEEIVVDGIKIKQIYKKTIFKSVNQSCFDFICKNEQLLETDKIIVATDQMDIKSPLSNVITIQHGIAFDIPGDLIPGFWRISRSFQFLNKLLRCIKNVKRLSFTRNTVCVDYNYFNWYRTLGTIRQNKKVTVIPNYSSPICFSEFKDKISKEKKIRKIVFARRFVDYRGVKVFANVVERILKERNDVEVTFAGSGPLEDFLQQKFSNNNKVLITSYVSSDSIEFHKAFDISIVPTIYSEGTSLSLLEGMSAGCIPISTYVGGLSNIVINGFNGYSIYPDEESLYLATKAVLDLDEENFNRVLQNSYNTILEGFSKKQWEKKWTSIIC